MQKADQIKAHELLQKCMEVTEKTGYDAWFDYSGHIDCISIYVKRKKSDSFIEDWTVLSFSRKWQEKVLAEVLTTLVSMLDGTYELEGVNNHE